MNHNDRYWGTYSPHKQQQPPYFHHYNPHATQPANRPTNNPNYYDQMFHGGEVMYHAPQGPTGPTGGFFQAQTRQDTNRSNLTNNRSMMDYNMFAPKFENHNEPVWSANANAKTHQYKQSQSKTKRDQPALQPGVQITRAFDDTISQQQRNSQFQSKQSRIDYFNTQIDSMYVPADLQRPVPSREMIRQELEAANTTKNTQTNDAISQRQFSFEMGPGLLSNSVSGGNFEDMFY
jgi:hypothetical protein